MMKGDSSLSLHASAVSKKDEGVVDLCADYALDNWPSTGQEWAASYPE
jgi:hypothetical protein